MAVITDGSEMAPELLLYGGPVAADGDVMPWRLVGYDGVDATEEASGAGAAGHQLWRGLCSPR